MFNNYNFDIDNDFLGENADVDTSFDYNSFYRAYVVSIEDPMKLGRVQVNIPTLHKHVTNQTQYPWAYPGVFVGLGNQTGQFILPPVGSIVFVAFEFSEEHRPIYFGGIPTRYAPGKTQSYGTRINNGQEVEVTQDDIPEEYDGSQAIVYKSPSGSIMYFDDANEFKKVVIKDSAEQSIEMVSGIIQKEDGTTEEKKAIVLSVDVDSKLILDDDELLLYINDSIYRFNKESLDAIFNGQPGSSTGESCKCQLTIWDEGDK